MRPGLLRWGKRIGLAVLVLVAVVTVGAFAYDAASAGGVPPQKLYAGPFVRVDGRLLAYRRWGTHGTPIVLIGGFVESSDVWRKVGPLLGRTHRVYALDLPPFGYSERKGPYTLPAWLDEIEGFDRALGIVRPTLVGHSLGAADVVGEALAAPACTARDRAARRRRDPRRRRAVAGSPTSSSIRTTPRSTGSPPVPTGSSERPSRARTGRTRRSSPTRISIAGSGRSASPARPPRSSRCSRTGSQGWTLADLHRVHNVPVVVAWGADDKVDSVSRRPRAPRPPCTRRSSSSPPRVTSRCSPIRAGSRPSSTASQARDPPAGRPSTVRPR